MPILESAMTQQHKCIIAPDFSDGVDRKLLKQVRDRFVLVNDRRLERTYESLTSRQADILRILPLLYHVNHPLLPGYVSKVAPYGVSNYTPDAEALSIVAGFSRTLRIKRDKRHKPDIQSLFIMGSSGTLAHSEASDVDAWLCISPRLSVEQETVLAVKARKIDGWANAEGLELHTFVMCAQRFKRGHAAPAMDKESSGSAQHFLLLDEFYRTAILLAGCYPLWWIVPPAAEVNYDEVTEMLIGKRFIKETEFLDFGSVADIPKSELVGAGLWQLYKSLESPYKSTLKLLLAEVYARELPRYPCLSGEFKQTVYNDELGVSKLDPYFLLYRRLENYLIRNQQEQRLDLVRKSFYLKVNKKLSRKVKPRSASWQRQLLNEQIETWDWTQKKLEYLDNRYDWNVTDVLEERQVLLGELTHAYRFLTSYARAHMISSSITQKDMTLLGRKLYAVFQRKAGKIERINLGITPSMWEENLALHHSSSQEVETEENQWLLFKGLVNAKDSAFTQPLKKSSSFIELLSWIYFNGIVSRATRLSLISGEINIGIREMHDALDTFTQVYPLPMPSVPQQAYQTSAKVQTILLLVNLGAKRVDEKESALQRISDKSDSLSYSEERYNLVQTIDQVVLNSWGEVSAVRYEVGETLLQNLQAYLQLCLEQPDEHFDLHVRCFSSFRSNAVESRVKALFYEARMAFFSSKEKSGVRYVLEVGKGFYLLQKSEELFRFQRFETRALLMARLQQFDQDYQPVSLDSYALEDSKLLKSVLPMSEAGSIQVFYIVRKRTIELCVIDERGSILEASIPAQDEALFQSAIYNFLTTVVERRQFKLSEAALSHVPNLDLYMMTQARDEFRSKRVKRIDLIEVERVQAMGVGEASELRFDYSLRNRDFPYTEYGEEQYSALQHFFKSKNPRPNLALKLTDVSFPADPLGISQAETRGQGVLDYLKVFVDFENNLPKS